MDIDEEHDTTHKHDMARKRYVFQTRVGVTFDEQIDDLRAKLRTDGRILPRGAFVRQLIRDLHKREFPEKAAALAQREAEAGIEDDED